MRMGGMLLMRRIDMVSSFAYLSSRFALVCPCVDVRSCTAPLSLDSRNSRRSTHLPSSR